MKAVISLLFVSVVVSQISFCQAALLVGWDMNGLSSYGPSPFVPSTTAENLTAGGLTRGSGFTLSGTSAGNAWGGNGLNTSSQASAIAANDIATFSITASVGFVLSISDIASFNVRRSSSGPTTGLWQYQVGSGSFADIGTAVTWGSVTSAAGNPQSMINLSGISALQNIESGTTVTFRVVNWGATDTGGNWYLNNFQVGNDFVLNGSITPVPEPITWALISFGAACGGAQLFRRWRAAR